MPEQDCEVLEEGMSAQKGKRNPHHTTVRGEKYRGIGPQGVGWGEKGSGAEGGRGRRDMKRERERKRNNNGRAAIYIIFLFRISKRKERSRMFEEIKTEKEKESICRYLTTSKQVYSRKLQGKILISPRTKEETGI